MANTHTHTLTLIQTHTIVETPRKTSCKQLPVIGKVAVATTHEINLWSTAIRSSEPDVAGHDGTPGPGWQKGPLESGSEREGRKRLGGTQSTPKKKLIRT